MMNNYPYNGGHLMVLPYREVPDFDDLTEDEMLEMMTLMRRCKKALTKTMQPHGFNIGVNLGRVAGAGIEQHLHIHVVPRWTGDVNFMPAIAQTSVIPEALKETAAKLRAALAEDQ